MFMIVIMQCSANSEYSIIIQLTEVNGTFILLTVLNIDVVVQSRDWIGLDKENLVSVLKRSDLVIKSEYELLKAVVRWLQDETRIHDLHSNLTAVLPYIRLAGFYRQRT